MTYCSRSAQGAETPSRDCFEWNQQVKAAVESREALALVRPFFGSGGGGTSSPLAALVRVSTLSLIGVQKAQDIHLASCCDLLGL